MSTVTSPGSAQEALAMLRSAMSYLSAADATQLAAETQAQCLLALEQVDAIETAARASLLGAFTAGQGYSAYADYSPRAWLVNKTRITKAAAVVHTAWVRRAAAHPQVVAALAEGHILSESVARTICKWTDKLPEDCRPAADAILILAARTGADLRGLAELAAEIYTRSLPDTPDGDPDETFEDRSVRLETTFDGAGVMTGDLTPECAAVVTAVLDALSAPAGAEDTRAYGQRYHDALEEAMRRLVAGGLLPERAGQPVKVWAHISLADLLTMDGSSALQEEWIASARAAWAAARAGASVGGSDGAAWLDSDAAHAVACDASVTPVVTGDVNPAALDDLVHLCVKLDKLRHHPGTSADGDPGRAAGQPDTTRAWAALEQAVIGKAVDLLSGPGGLASFLRRRQLGARLGGPSLPLDVGISKDIPAAIRNAVILRDKHCQWTGGCDQPAAACEVHHLTHRANGGKTSVKDCILFCTFHHQVVIHRWGWTVVLNPDGTTTAWNKDKTKILHSHSPPVLRVHARLGPRVRPARDHSGHCLLQPERPGPGKMFAGGSRLGDPGPMDLGNAARSWHAHGFVILPGFIPADELKSAVSELDLLFPSSGGFHDGTDPRRDRFIGDEFAGIDTFPFASTEISLLAVNHRVLALAEALLDDADIHIYTAEAWAKYTGACDYDQDMHRDYLNHTVLVPSTTPGCRQVEMFVFLTDVPEDLGPPRVVSRTHTADIPAVPNWFLRPGQESTWRFNDDSGSPELYEAEVSGAGPAGTVIAFEAGTFHRGTQLTAPRGVRYSMHLGFRPSSLQWGQRVGWAARSFEREWVDFVGRATPRQLQAFGFPPPGHPYWTPETLAGMALRYPELDLTPWRKAG